MVPEMVPVPPRPQGRGLCLTREKGSRSGEFLGHGPAARIEELESIEPDATIWFRSNMDKKTPGLRLGSQICKLLRMMFRSRH